MKPTYDLKPSKTLQTSKRRSSMEPAPRPPTPNPLFAIFQSKIGVPIVSMPIFYQRPKTVVPAFSLSVEDFLPELEISQNTLKNIRMIMQAKNAKNDMKIYGKYMIFNETGKIMMKCDELLKNSENSCIINCYTRENKPGKIQKSSIRIKKIEMKELCEDLSKNMTTLQPKNIKTGPKFTEFIKTSLIFSLKQENQNNLLIKLIAAFPDLSIVFCAIKPFIINNAPQLNISCGFLGLTTDKRIIPFDFTNPKSIPIIGIWTNFNGFKKTKQQNELLFSLIMRFLFVKGYGQKASQNSESYVWVDFGINNAGSKQNQFYEFKIKPALNTWVMQVSSGETDCQNALKIQLTTKKSVAKQNIFDSSLYKLSRAISMVESEEQKPKDFRKNGQSRNENKENMHKYMRLSMEDLKSKQSQSKEIPENGRKSALSIRNAEEQKNEPKTAIRVNLLNSQPEETSTIKHSRNSLLNGARGSLPPSGREEPMSHQKTTSIHRSGSMGNSSRRSSSIAKRVIAQQNIHIQVLQQNIVQMINAMKEIKEKGGNLPNTELQIPVLPNVFDINNRFKANMANCQQLNISNNFGQASPSFMQNNGDDEIISGRSSRNSLGHNGNFLSMPDELTTLTTESNSIKTDGCSSFGSLNNSNLNIIAPNPENKPKEITVLKMYQENGALSAIKETNESVTSPDVNGTDSSGKIKEKIRQENINYIVPKIAF